MPFIQTLPFIHLFLNALLLWQDALAPYQHIEQDLRSLKEVVEMKNQQIHQQEKKISDLEKVVGSNKPPFSTLPFPQIHTISNRQKGQCGLYNDRLRYGCFLLLSRPKRTCSSRKKCRFCNSRMKILKLALKRT